MSRSDRGNGTAVRLVVIALVLVVSTAASVYAISWGRSVEAEYFRDADNRTKQYTVNTYGKEYQRCIALPLKLQRDCMVDATNKARSNEREEQDLVAQKISALWAFMMGAAAVVGVGLSAVGVMLVWTTFNATKEGNAIAREIGQAQIRAYVTLAADTLYMHPSTQPPWRPNINFKLTNTGLTPAEEVSIGVKWQLVRLGKIEFEGESFAPTYDGLISVAGNGGMESADAVYDKESVPADMIEAIRHGQATWRIKCDISYLAGREREHQAYMFTSMVFDQGDGTMVQKWNNGTGFAIRLQRISTEM
jgi:hypothetical protein